MKKIILFGLMFLCIVVYAKPSRHLSTRQLQFIDMLVPKINLANQQIKASRKTLIYLHLTWHRGKVFTTKEKQWLYKLAHTYAITDPSISERRTWQLLLRRVDVLPDSLVLAQAITESGWGQSFFATQGNNYFGQWCTKPGCGIVPRRRPKGATFEVRKYASVFASVKSYILNINTNRSYIKLRKLREQIRMNHEVITGMALTKGLSHYSTKGEKYIALIQKIIRKYDLAQFDQV